MEMSPSKLLFYLSPVFSHLLVLTMAQTNPLTHICLQNHGNFSANSDFKSNLDSLMSSFSSDTNIDYGFYNGSIGENIDKAYAISLCRGDKKPETCRSCIQNSSQVLSQLCPNQKEAYIWYDDCMLRYANRSIFNSMEFGPYFWMYNLVNVTDEKEFSEVLNALLGRLINSAASGDSRRKFAAGNATAENSRQTMYALVQCTPDLTQPQCSDCLNKAIKLIPTCCSKRQGGRVVSPSCHFRYEKDPFYDLASTWILPPPPPPPPQILSPTSLPTPSQAKTQQLYIVRTAIANVLLVLLWSLQHV